MSPLVALSIANLLLAFLPVWWFGRRAPGYSHRRDTISELGAPGMPDASRVAWLAFAPLGAMVLAYAFLLRQALGGEDAVAPTALLALVGASYLGAAIFPCDPGAPFGGSARNQMHNLIGGLGYFGGGAALIEFARRFEDADGLHALAVASKPLGIAVLLGIVALSMPSPLRGLLQRLVEAVLFGWMLAAAILIGR
jgi:hypothetical protein